MIATEGGNFFAVKLPPAGTYPAWCYSLIDIGIIETEYKGVKSKSHRIYITFEMPTIKASFSENRNPEPFVVGLELTLITSDRANLTKLVQNWRSKPFTPEEKRAFNPTVMVGKPALVNIIHKRKSNYANMNIDEITNENTFLKFNGISSVPQGMQMPEKVNEAFIWDWDEQIKNFNAKMFSKIPNWLADKTKGSDQYATMLSALNMTEAQMDDRIDAIKNERRAEQGEIADPKNEKSFDIVDDLKPKMSGW